MAYANLNNPDDEDLQRELGVIESRRDDFRYSWERDELSEMRNDTEPEEGHLLQDWLEGEPREHLSYEHHLDMLRQEQMDRFERDAERREYFLRKKSEFKREKTRKELEQKDERRQTRHAVNRPSQDKSSGDISGESSSSKVPTGESAGSEHAPPSDAYGGVSEQIVLLERAWALVKNGGLSSEEYTILKNRILGSEN